MSLGIKLSREQLLLEELEDDFDKATGYGKYTSAYEIPPPVAPIPKAQVRPFPPGLTIDQTLLADLYQRMDRLRWLSEGPDDHQTIDETIT